MRHRKADDGARRSPQRRHRPRGARELHHQRLQMHRSGARPHRAPGPARRRTRSPPPGSGSRRSDPESSSQSIQRSKNARRRIARSAMPRSGSVTSRGSDPPPGRASRPGAPPWTGNARTIRSWRGRAGRPAGRWSAHPAPAHSQARRLHRECARRVRSPLARSIMHQK